MGTISFLLGILLTIAVCEVRQASSSAAAAQQVLDTLQLTNCDDLKLRLACLQRRYRSLNGDCNNLCNITNGATNQPHQRFPGLNPTTEYDSPDFLPRSRSSTMPPDGRVILLPNARTLSNQVFVSGTGNQGGPPNFTHLTMTWGQFIDHDVTLTQLTPNVECGINNAPCPPVDGNCNAITIENGQKLAFNQSAQCIPMVRSLRDANGNQMNEITPFIDGSQVYGSDEVRSQSLRANILGLMRVEPFPLNSGVQPILPAADEEEFCRSSNFEEEPCLLGGDVRVNENQGLTAMHTLWVREHNRIALQLHVLNPSWQDERLFQEARKIVGAEIQHITYNEWLAVIFPSEELRDSSGILPLQEGFFTGYDPTINNAIFNGFATAAFRMGHSLIRDQLELLIRGVAAQNQPEPIPTREFFNPNFLYEDIRGNSVYGLLFRGLVGRRAQRVDRIFSPAVKERLIFEGPPPDGFVADLTSLNIQRGRGHGLPGYVKYRDACGLSPVSTFGSLAGTISLADRQRLKEIYTSPFDIDLFVGGILEIPLYGSILGPTFSCIFQAQFKNLRFGDRFWYERDDHQTGFTYEQLTEIRKSNIARVICDNANDVVNIQKRAFEPATNPAGNNPRFFCNELDFVNLNVFQEGAGVPAEGAAEEGGESIAAVGV